MSYLRKCFGIHFLSRPQSFSLHRVLGKDQRSTLATSTAAPRRTTPQVALVRQSPGTPVTISSSSQFGETLSPSRQQRALRLTTIYLRVVFESLIPASSCCISAVYGEPSPECSLKQPGTIVSKMHLTRGRLKFIISEAG